MDPMLTQCEESNPLTDLSKPETHSQPQVSTQNLNTGGMQPMTEKIQAVHEVQPAFHFSSLIDYFAILIQHPILHAST